MLSIGNLAILWNKFQKIQTWSFIFWTKRDILRTLIFLKQCIFSRHFIHYQSYWPWIWALPKGGNRLDSHAARRAMLSSDNSCWYMVQLGHLPPEKLFKDNQVLIKRNHCTLEWRQNMQIKSSVNLSLPIDMLQMLELVKNLVILTILLNISI